MSHLHGLLLSLVTLGCLLAYLHPAAAGSALRLTCKDDGLGGCDLAAGNFSSLLALETVATDACVGVVGSPLMSVRFDLLPTLDGSTAMRVCVFDESASCQGTPSCAEPISNGTSLRSGELPGPLAPVAGHVDRYFWATSTTETAALLASSSARKRDLASCQASFGLLRRTWGRWCGSNHGGYQNCCRGKPCPACNPKDTTVSAECLRQCPPIDLYSNEMEATSTIISTTPPFHYPTISTSTTLPSSPESGSESSPQSSPQTSPYNDFLFSLPVLAIKDEAPSPSNTSTSLNTSTSTLPSIEPFPPRSPIFAALDDQMRPIIGNVGVAAPMDVVPISSKAVVSSPTSGSYRQHLGEPLVRPAGIIKPSSASAAADDDDCAAGKKRRRAATAGAVPSEIAAATSGVVLPRDTLLKLSSSEMEAYLQTLKSSRELTHVEEKQLKKQLRLIKNREYAQESRKKKKSAHQELEGELNSLRTQNSELRTHNSALQSEVVLLNSKLAAVTSENTRLRSALRQMQHFHHSQKKQKTNANNKRQRDDGGDYPGAAPSSPSSWFSLGLGSASVQSPRAVAGGVCLLGVAIFALSFLLQGPGMFVGSSTHGDMGWSPTARVILEQEETRTTHFRRSTWVASPPTSTITDTSTQQDAKPAATQGKGVAKCGYDNMCYLYVDKAHHVKTLESSGSLTHQQREQEQRHDDDIQSAAADHLRHNRTHHAIPIPVH